MEERLELLNRIARGQVQLEGDSDDSSTSAGESEGEGGEGMEVFQPPHGEIPADQATRRMALVNCDWDHMRAVDIMALMQVRRCAVRATPVPHAALLPRSPSVRRAAL